MSILRIGDPRKLATYGFVMAVRGAFVLMRLIVVLGLPYVLGPAALGMFGTFSAVVAVLPIVVGFGVPQYLIRRIANNVHLPSFRILALHSLLGCGAALLVALAWIEIYPDIDAFTGVFVAIVAAVEVVKVTLYNLAIARSSIIRANLVYVFSAAGPSIAVAFAYLLLGGQISLATVIGFWVVTNTASLLVALTVARRDVSPLFAKAVAWPAISRRYAAAVGGARDIFFNQMVDVARVYCDRLIVPLLVGFYWAGIYNFFALGANVTVMICNATLGQTDLPQLIRASEARSWGEFRRIALAGARNSVLLAIAIMLPLFFLEAVAATVLKTPIDRTLYFGLTFSALLVAVSGSLADYLWNAVYAAHCEGRLGPKALVTVPLGIILVVAGTAIFGLVGALIAVALTSCAVTGLRWRALHAHMLDQERV